MKRKILLLLVLSLWMTFIFGQVNLVPNGGFEDYSQCPQKMASFYGFVNNWKHPDINTLGPICTPDYHNRCAPLSKVDPDRYPYATYPYCGSAYAGICPFVDLGANPDWWEYIQVKLNAPLKPNKKYYVSYMVAGHHDATNGWNNIGLYISNTAIKQSSANSPILKVPQIKQSKMIQTRDQWQEVSGTYTAHGGEEYITIGFFGGTPVLNVDYQKLPLPSSKNNSFTPQRPHYVVIDEVSITECNSTNKSSAFFNFRGDSFDYNACDLNPGVDLVKCSIDSLYIDCSRSLGEDKYQVIIEETDDNCVVIGTPHNGPIVSGHAPIKQLIDPALLGCNKSYKITLKTWGACGGTPATFSRCVKFESWLDFTVNGSSSSIVLCQKSNLIASINTCQKWIPKELTYLNLYKLENDVFKNIRSEFGDFKNFGKLEPGVYELRFEKDPNLLANSCIPQKTIKIIVPEAPKFLAHSSKEEHISPCYGDDCITIGYNPFSDVLPNPTNRYTFRWKFHDFNNSEEIYYDGLVHEICPVKYGEYELTITDENGCEFKKYLTITEPMPPREEEVIVNFCRSDGDLTTIPFCDKVSWSHDLSIKPYPSEIVATCLNDKGCPIKIFTYKISYNIAEACFNEISDICEGEELKVDGSCSDDHDRYHWSIWSAPGVWNDRAMLWKGSYTEANNGGNSNKAGYLNLTQASGVQLEAGKCYYVILEVQKYCNGAYSWDQEIKHFCVRPSPGPFTIETYLLECDEDCVDIGDNLNNSDVYDENAPYTVSWEDGSTEFLRNVCPPTYNYTATYTNKWGCSSSKTYSLEKDSCCLDACFELPDIICEDESIIPDISCMQDNISSYRWVIHEWNELTNSWDVKCTIDYIDGPVQQVDFTEHCNFIPGKRYAISLDVFLECNGEVVTKTVHNEFEYKNYVIHTRSVDRTNGSLVEFEDFWEHACGHRSIKRVVDLSTGQTYYPPFNLNMNDFPEGSKIEIVYNNCCVLQLTLNGEPPAPFMSKIDNRINEKFAKIYPNPTLGVLNISYSEVISESATIEVYNMVGVRVKTSSLTKTASIDLSAFAKGMYIVKITNGTNAVETRKIILQ